MKFQVQQCVAFRLRRLSRIADSAIRKALSSFNITENQMNILFALDMMGKVEQGMIGKNLGLERSTVSRAVRLLEKRAYIIRTSDYQPQVELTVEGKELVQTLMPIWEKFMGEIYAKIGSEGMEKIAFLEGKVV